MRDINVPPIRVYYGLIREYWAFKLEIWQATKSQVRESGPGAPGCSI